MRWHTIPQALENCWLSSLARSLRTASLRTRALQSLPSLKMGVSDGQDGGLAHKVQSAHGVLVFGLGVAVLALGCEAGGVGDPCTPEDEFLPYFSGFSLAEVNVESRSFQCETRVCLVNKFQGRVSCPYGTLGTNDANDSSPSMGLPTVDHPYNCKVPGLDGFVEVAVAPQRIERPPEQAVYCSCRCSGTDLNARYCECPSGFSCEEVVPSSTDGSGNGELAGGYCIRADSDVDVNTVSDDKCTLPLGDDSPTGTQLTCGNAPS